MNTVIGEQGWRSGETSRLPLMWFISVFLVLAVSSLGLSLLLFLFFSNSNFKPLIAFFFFVDSCSQCSQTTEIQTFSPAGRTGKLGKVCMLLNVVFRKLVASFE